MPTYKCSACNTTSNNKSNMEKHIKFLKCRDKEPEIFIIGQKISFDCPGCDKSYKSASGLDYHKPRCEELKEMKKPENIFNSVQQQTGESKQIKILIEEINKLKKSNEELKKAQEKTDKKVDVIVKYLSSWHQPYIQDDFFDNFHKIIENGISDKAQVFPNLISYIYSYPDNFSICHKNKRTNLVSVHEDSKWISKTSETVYPKVAEIYDVFINTLRVELPYESKIQIRNKRKQLDFEQENKNNTKYKKTIIKQIEADFQSRSRFCDTSKAGEEKNDAVIVQNSQYVFKQNAKNFKEAFGIFNIKLKSSVENDEEELITDDEQESDPEYELKEDNFDNYYDENGVFRGTISEQNKYIRMRRKILNERRANKMIMKQQIKI